jgi:hypothetical protein
MKEIWIEKLIELLNERKWSKLYYAANWSIRMVWEFPISELEIISKKFWFIKWLVENDKIDLDKVEEKSDLIEYLIGTPTKVYENIIMLLSISDTPIEDLISYLK